MAEFESSNLLVGNLFQDRFFRIPAYQRPFSWDDEHFDDLISDTKDADRTKPYFLGTMVLHKEQDSTYAVVDGQQRLTSLLILFACLRDAIDDEQFKNELQDKIKQQERVIDGIPSRVRLEVKESDVFHSVVVERHGTLKPHDPQDYSSSEMRYFSAVKIFHKSIEPLIPSGVKADSFGFSARRLSDSMLASRRFAMRPGIELRTDYDAARLRPLVKATRNAGQSRRLLALAEIYDGGTRTKAARVGGVGLQTVRDWVVRFNARGPEGLVDGKAPGNVCKLRAHHREALLALVESGPIPAVHGVVRWRLKDLVQWLWDEFRIEVSETTLGRELRALGYRKLSARPRHHAKSEAAVAAFKKTSPRVWRRSLRGRLAASR